MKGVPTLTLRDLRDYIVSTEGDPSPMKARLVKIGNSRGVRLPKPLIEEAGLTEEVEVRVRDGAVVITAAGRPRAGWAAAARRLRERGDGPAAEAPTGTRFDAGEWEWE